MSSKAWISAWLVGRSWRPSNAFFLNLLWWLSLLSLLSWEQSVTLRCGKWKMDWWTSGTKPNHQRCRQDGYGWIVITCHYHPSHQFRDFRYCVQGSAVKMFQTIGPSVWLWFSLSLSLLSLCCHAFPIYYYRYILCRCTTFYIDIL